ncbi:MAG: class I mannose-6-phosphate isomerase [Planctomycetes bacterium]|nr:class I mannose-6-phosphate isomerase [Planctomycetota bacterium]MBL7008220.1 class I mannose-6-phosphate isomerase [Planctomycetota bacterium]
MEAVSLPREPLFFQRIGKPTVWGGRALAGDLGWTPPFDAPLGETWELSDVAGSESLVRGGVCAGQSLRQIMAQHGRKLLGRSKPGADGRFPLLIKFLEAAQDLSVQVHPADGQLAPEVAGKIECWSFLQGCAADASVYCGFADGVDQEAYRAVAGSREGVSSLREHRVSPGDFLFVPPGKPHAIRAGVRLLEVQQTSDTTYRLYDWDRPGLDGGPRQLHLEQALPVLDFDSPVAAPFAPTFRSTENGNQAALLVQCEPFIVRALRLKVQHLFRQRSYAYVLTVVRGGGAVCDPAGDFPRRGLAFGDVFLVPANLGPILLEPDDEGLELIEATAL